MATLTIQQTNHCSIITGSKWDIDEFDYAYDKIACNADYDNNYISDTEREVIPTISEELLYELSQELDIDIQH